MYSQQTVHSSETSIINLHLSVKKTDWKVAAMKISHDSTCTVTMSAETDCCDWTSRTTTWLLQLLSGLVAGAGEAAGDCGNFIHPPAWQTHWTLHWSWSPVFSGFRLVCNIREKDYG